MQLVRILHALAIIAAVTGTARAEDWPAHPLRLIVPFPAGGSADTQSRVIAEGLAAAIGQPVIVDNRPGAGGNIAAAEAARAAPDGYTLFMATTGTHASNISLYKNLGFDPVKDFAPLTLGHAQSAAHRAGAAIWRYRFRRSRRPAARSDGGASFGSSGIGSATHIAGELYNKVTGSALVHVPYRGQGPALNDLLAGRIDAMFPLVADVFSFLQSGQLKAVAAMSEQRAKSLPDMPTTAELGYPKLVLSPIWTALYTNAGTPQPIVDRLNSELVRSLRRPSFVGRFEAAAMKSNQYAATNSPVSPPQRPSAGARSSETLNIQVE